MARRNYTQELRDAAGRGATVVYSTQPHEGTPVHFAPRRLRDPKPWTFLENGSSYQGMWRFSGRECHALHPFIGLNMWLDTSAKGQPGVTLVHVSHVDETAGTAQVKAEHWHSVSTVRLDRLHKANPAR